MSKVQNASDKQHSRAEHRRAVASAQTAEAKRSARRWQLLTRGGAAVAVVAVVAVIVALAAGGGDGSRAASGAPVVGGDLHTVMAVDDVLYVGGHAQAAVSRDDGKTWQEIASLEGADPMGWAASEGELLAGGHPGLYRSTDGGTNFEKLAGSAAVPDVHALGGAGGVLYLASPQTGVMASTDGGRSWGPRNAEAGRSFMGTILVDPTDTDRLIAPDMAGALATSSDGGRTWQSLEGPMGAMAATWNPANTDEIIAVGMQGAERSTDGGATWGPIQLPSDTSAVVYSPDGQTLYAGVLSGEQAVVYRSTDGGQAWTPTT